MSQGSELIKKEAQKYLNLGMIYENSLSLSYLRMARTIIEGAGLRLEDIGTTPERVDSLMKVAARKRARALVDRCLEASSPQVIEDTNELHDLVEKYGIKLEDVGASLEGSDVDMHPVGINRLRKRAFLGIARDQYERAATGDTPPDEAKALIVRMHHNLAEAGETIGAIGASSVAIDKILTRV